MKSRLRKKGRPLADDRSQARRAYNPFHYCPLLGLTPLAPNPADSPRRRKRSGLSVRTSNRRTWWKT